MEKLEHTPMSDKVKERIEKELLPTCKTCNGSGEVEDNGPKACPKCGGNGFIESMLYKDAEVWAFNHIHDDFGLSPQDGYIAGATAERPKARNEAIDECRYEVALWLTEPEKLGSALMDKLEKLKHKQP